MMNKSEQKAYKWLLQQGLSPDAINFNARRTPDFITQDGRGFEVKRLYKDKIIIRDDQLNRLKQDHSTTVLVMADDKEEPVAQIPTSQLESGTTIKGVFIHIVERSPIIRVSEQVKTAVDYIKQRNGHKSHDSVIRTFILETDGSIW